MLQSFVFKVITAEIESRNKAKRFDLRVIWHKEEDTSCLLVSVEKEMRANMRHKPLIIK